MDCVVRLMPPLAKVSFNMSMPREGCVVVEVTEPVARNIARGIGYAYGNEARAFKVTGGSEGWGVAVKHNDLALFKRISDFAEGVKFAAYNHQNIWS